VAVVKPGPQGKVAYELPSSGSFKAPYVPCAVADGDAVFLLYDEGFASCIDAPTGKLHWTQPRTETVFFGSPVRVRDKIYCIDVEGVVWVLAADASRYQLLAKNPLGERSHATPAVANGKMFLRTFSHLIAVGGGRD
jgi:hypothetical protein